MTFYAKHPVTGKYDAYPDHYRTHPVFGKFEEVAKSTYDNSGCEDCGLEPTEAVDAPVEADLDVIEDEVAFRWPSE